MESIYWQRTLLQTKLDCEYDKNHLTPKLSNRLNFTTALTPGEWGISIAIVVDMGNSNSDFVVIDKVQGELTAHVIKSHLESEGIPVLLQYESAGAIFGLTLDGLGEVKILVPQELAEEAKHIIKISE